LQNYYKEIIKGEYISEPEEIYLQIEDKIKVLLSLGLIEKTMNNAQCSHGRPTYVKLTKKDLEKMFLRI
jgi:DNA mismatch repair ATPase MutL